MEDYVIEHRSAKLVFKGNTLTKIYENRDDFKAEVTGLKIVKDIPGVIDVINIDNKKQSITYERGTQLVMTPDLVKPVLTLAANFIDRLHKENITHGDFYVLNMVVVQNKDKPLHIKFIDFETTKSNANIVEMGRDIINLLEDLSLNKHLKSYKPWIENLLHKVTDTVTEKRRTVFGKLKDVTYKIIKPEVIGNFRFYIE